MTRAERVLLATIVLARVALGAARLAADPARAWNDEEAYNATEAWLLAHAPLWDQLPALQYRSFCGGCTVVAVLGAPLLAVSQAFWAWKSLALAWTAATQLVGFAALDALAGRAAAWAFVLLLALPPAGALDLSGMLWGNHQESGLLAVLALLLIAREKGAWAGLVLGVAVWFTRTALYQAVVLLPVALVWLRGQRLATLAGFGVGLSLLLLPTAAGDTGFYRMRDALGGDVAKRAVTLFAPGDLAARLWLPVRGMAPAAVVWLGAAAFSAAWSLRSPRNRPIVALVAAFAVAYCVTRFPLFLVGPDAPVNNIRYHAPWAFLLALLVAAGVGAAWAAGWRRIAFAVLVAVLGADAAALTRLDWTPDPRLAELPAINPSEFVAVATSRLPDAVLARRADHPLADAVLARMRGLRLGDDVRRGRISAEVGLAEPDLRVLAGVGEALVDPCDGAAVIGPWLAGLDAEAQRALGRGMGVTLGLCRPTDPGARVAALRTGDGCPACSAAGADAVAGCRAPRPDGLADCLLARVGALPEVEEVLYGAGRAYAGPRRAPSEVAAVAVALGEHGPVFLAGARDPAAGARVPSLARGRPPTSRP